MGVATSLAGILRTLRPAFDLDLRSLALFRIGLGAMVIVDAGFRMYDANVFLVDSGLTTRSEAMRAGFLRAPSLYYLDGSPSANVREKPGSSRITVGAVRS
jgi:hypothetical protein